MTISNNRPQRQMRDPRGIRWWDPANLVLAIWLFISPWVLQFGANTPVVAPAQGGPSAVEAGVAAWNAWVLAVIVFLVALSAMGRLARGQETINLLLGIWIFIAPWVLGFAAGADGAAAWDHWIVGALVFLVSAAALSTVRRERAGVVSTATLDEAEARQSLRR
jgi:hypothetical protein